VEINQLTLNPHMTTPKTATIAGIDGQDAVAKLIKPSELW